MKWIRPGNSRNRGKKKRKPPLVIVVEEKRMFKPFFVVFCFVVQYCCVSFSIMTAHAQPVVRVRGRTQDYVFVWLMEVRSSVSGKARLEEIKEKEKNPSCKT